MHRLRRACARMHVINICPFYRQKHNALSKCFLMILLSRYSLKDTLMTFRMRLDVRRVRIGAPPSVQKTGPLKGSFYVTSIRQHGFDWQSVDVAEATLRPRDHTRRHKHHHTNDTACQQRRDNATVVQRQFATMCRVSGHHTKASMQRCTGS